MRICFLGGMSGGGTESACYKVANELAAQNDIFILSTAKFDPLFPLSHSVHFSKIKETSIFKRWIELFHFIRDNRIEVLISLEAMSGIFTLMPSKLSGCRVIIWEHANYYQNQGSRWIQKIRQLEILMADAYVVLTKRDLGNFQSHFRVKTRLKYIYNIAPFYSDHQYAHESKTILSAGHIHLIKNYIVIPEIARSVFSKHPDWCWKIYGTPSGEYYEQVLAKVKEYGLEHHVLFCGRSKNMQHEYQDAAIYVMTSLYEGLPMVLLEAKANGLPLVSFDIETGPDEIIRDGVNGFLIPPYDTKIMAERICQLIENNDLRKRFSDNAKLDLEKFSSDRIIEQWNDLIKDVTER